MSVLSCLLLILHSLILCYVLSRILNNLQLNSLLYKCTPYQCFRNCCTLHVIKMMSIMACYKKLNWVPSCLRQLIDTSFTPCVHPLVHTYSALNSNHLYTPLPEFYRKSNDLTQMLHDILLWHRGDLGGYIMTLCQCVHLSLTQKRNRVKCLILYTDHLCSVLGRVVPLRPNGITTLGRRAQYSTIAIQVNLSNNTIMKIDFPWSSW